MLTYNKTGDDLIYNHRLVMVDGSFKYVARIGKGYKMKREKLSVFRELCRILQKKHSLNK
jgi:hypothetical protein